MKQMVKEIVTAVSGWRAAALKLGLSRGETDRMAGDFEKTANVEASAFAGSG